jgi:hypothetical protein
LNHFTVPVSFINFLFLAATKDQTKPTNDRTKLTNSSPTRKASTVL